MRRSIPIWVTAILPLYLLLSGCVEALALELPNTSNYGLFQLALNMGDSAVTRCIGVGMNPQVTDFVRAEAHHLGETSDADRQRRQVQDVQAAASAIGTQEFCKEIQSAYGPAGTILPGLVVGKGSSFPRVDLKAPPISMTGIDLIRQRGSILGKRVKIDGAHCLHVADGTSSGSFVCSSREVQAQGNVSYVYNLLFVGVDIPDEGSRKDLEMRCSIANPDAPECVRTLVLTPVLFFENDKHPTFMSEAFAFAERVDPEKGANPPNLGARGQGIDPGSFRPDPASIALSQTRVGPKSLPDLKPLELTWNDKLVELTIQSMSGGNKTYLLDGKKFTYGFGDFVPTYVSHAAFKVEGGSLTVSALEATMLGPNEYCGQQPSTDASLDYSDCPARVLVNTGGKIQLRVLDKICVVDSERPGDGTFANYDSAAGTLHFTAFHAGKIIAECDRTVAVGQGRPLPFPPPPHLDLVLDGGSKK